MHQYVDTLKIPVHWLDFWDLQLFKLGKTPVTALMLAEIVLAILLLLLFSSWLQRRAITRLLSHSHFDQGVRQTIGTLVRYAVLIIGFIIIMQTIGIDLTALSVLAGAVGVGIGFGLQNIFSNFISGLIVMFERPIKIGDHIEISGVVDGDVVEIGARATKVMTGYGSTVIIPNQTLITGPVITWSTDTHTTSVVVAIKASSASAPVEIQRLILDAAKSVDGIRDSPAPVVYVTSVDANAYSLEFQGWVACDAACRKQLGSALRLAICSHLSAHEVKLAPP